MGLTDTPANYTAAASKLVSVDAASTGVEFTAPVTFYDYGTSLSASTAEGFSSMIVCRGRAIANGTTTITGLPFANTTSYTVLFAVGTPSGGYAVVPYCTYVSGARFDITEGVSGTQRVNWAAIGI